MGPAARCSILPCSHHGLWKVTVCSSGSLCPAKSSRTNRRTSALEFVLSVTTLGRLRQTALKIDVVLHPITDDVFEPGLNQVYVQAGAVCEHDPRDRLEEGTHEAD